MVVFNVSSAESDKNLSRAPRNPGAPAFLERVLRAPAGLTTAGAYKGEEIVSSVRPLEVLAIEMTGFLASLEANMLLVVDRLVGTGAA